MHERGSVLVLAPADVPADDQLVVGVQGGPGPDDTDTDLALQLVGDVALLAVLIEQPTTRLVAQRLVPSVSSEMICARFSIVALCACGLGADYSAIASIPSTS